jgi:predicted NUDIX family NTP pyrophosphohydrolase
MPGNHASIDDVQTSAGLLMYRVRDGRLEVLLAHPGGPLFAKKDEGAWSIPKGLIDRDEAALAAARREFTEETSFALPEQGYVALGEVMQGKKRIVAWALEGDCEPAELRSNTFELEWPPRSGRRASFPEVDRIEWFTLERAREKLNPSQVAFLERLRAGLEEG